MKGMALAPWPLVDHPAKVKSNLWFPNSNTWRPRQGHKLPRFLVYSFQAIKDGKCAGTSGARQYEFVRPPHEVESNTKHVLYNPIVLGRKGNVARPAIHSLSLESRLLLLLHFQCRAQRPDVHASRTASPFLQERMVTSPEGQEEILNRTRNLLASLSESLYWCQVPVSGTRWRVLSLGVVLTGGWTSSILVIVDIIGVRRGVNLWLWWGGTFSQGLLSRWGWWHAEKGWFLLSFTLRKYNCWASTLNFTYTGAYHVPCATWWKEFVFFLLVFNGCGALER